MSPSSKIDFTKSIDYTVLVGKVALVTGAATGIGREIATALAEHGAWVGICDINSTAGKDLEASLHQRGLKAHFVETDILSWDSQKAAFQKIAAWPGQDGRIDIFVANAGLLSVKETIFTASSDVYTTMDQVSPPDLKILNTNLVGTYYTASLAFWQFKLSTTKDEKFLPQLVFMGSLKSYEGFPYEVQYPASKSGIRAIWKAIRRPQPGRPDFQTNFIAPAFVDTVAVATQYHTDPFESGFRVAHVKDVSEATLRSICDSEIEGRAIAVAKALDGKPYGSANFDLEDDMMDFSGSRAFVENALAGVFGSIPQL